MDACSSSAASLCQGTGDRASFRLRNYSGDGSPVLRALLPPALARESARQAPFSQAKDRAVPRLLRLRYFQRTCPPSSPPDHAVAVGPRCFKASTKTPPRSRLKHQRRPLHPFSHQEGVDKIGYLIPLAQKVCKQKKLSPVGTLSPPTRARFYSHPLGLQALFRLPARYLEVRSTPSAPVEQAKSDTAR